jgi:hypothetical protein
MAWSACVLKSLLWPKNTVGNAMPARIIAAVSGRPQAATIIDQMEILIALIPAVSAP